MAYPNLRAEMARHNVTAEELSKKVNVTQATFSNWFNGKTEPSISKARVIAEYFGCSIDYLFSNDTLTN